MLDVILIFVERMGFFGIYVIGYSIADYGIVRKLPRLQSKNILPVKTELGQIFRENHSMHIAMRNGFDVIAPSKAYRARTSCGMRDLLLEHGAPIIWRRSRHVHWECICKFDTLFSGE